MAQIYKFFCFSFFNSDLINSVANDLAKQERASKNFQNKTQICLKDYENPKKLKLSFSIFWNRYFARFSRHRNDISKKSIG